MADLKKILFVSLGVVVAGLIMNFGKDLPLIGDARKGFDV